MSDFPSIDIGTAISILVSATRAAVVVEEGDDSRVFLESSLASIASAEEWIEKAKSSLLATRDKRMGIK